MAKPRAALGLGLLCGINLINFADRFVVGGVQELIKRDPTLPGGLRDAAGHLSDASLGLLTTVFVVVFMLASPFTGWLGDRVKRRYLVFGGALVWSLATLGSGLAGSFATLLLARAFIGAGEAGYATVAPSLIADLYDERTRCTAMGAYNAVMPLGAAVGFAVGGTVGALYSWRAAFWVAGVPGLLLATAYLFLPEPERGRFDDASAQRQPLGAWATVVALVRNRDFMFNTAAQVLFTFTIGGLANWMPSFFARALHFSAARAGQDFGVLLATAGIAGTVLGTAAGEWAQRRHPRGYFKVSGWSLLAAAPCIVLLARAPGVTETLGITFAALLLIFFNGAPLYTALMNCVPPGLRASAVALNLLAIHVFGDAISPPIVGAISDATGHLGTAVACCAAPVFLAGVVLLRGARVARESAGVVSA